MSMCTVNVLCKCVLSMYCQRVMSMCTFNVLCKCVLSLYCQCVMSMCTLNVMSICTVNVYCQSIVNVLCQYALSMCYVNVYCQCVMSVESKVLFYKIKVQYLSVAYNISVKLKRNAFPDLLHVYMKSYICFNVKNSLFKFFKAFQIHPIYTVWTNIQQFYVLLTQCTYVF